MLFLAGALVKSRDVDDTVCIDIECDLDLRYPSGSRSDSVKNEASECGVAACHLALALKDVYLNGGLAVSRS